LGTLSVAIALVLLIVCANIAHLTLARTERRRRELAVRAALGARRGRLTRQLLAESALLTTAGGLAGLLLTKWGLRLLAGLSHMPQLRPIEVDGHTLAIAFSVSAVAMLCFGLWPAWRGGNTPINSHLKNSGNAATLDSGARRHGRLLASLEVALALMLLSGAGLMIRSVILQLRADPGFVPDHLLSITVNLTPAGTFSRGPDAHTHARISRAMDRLASLPGVEAVGSYKRAGPVVSVESTSGETLGRGVCGYVSVGEQDFFSIARVPLLAGHAFTIADIGDGKTAVLVNERMARICWPDRDPIGQTFINNKGPALTTGPSPTYEVIGVVGDMQLDSVDAEIVPQFFRPLAEAPSWGMPNRILMRTAQDPALLAGAARTALREVDAEMGQPYIVTATTALFNSTLARRTYRNYLCVFAVAAVVLAALGIHSVLAYSVARRTREIGIRMALGADRQQVVGMIISEGGRVVIAGIAGGLAGALGLGHLMRAKLYGTAPWDPLVLVLVPAVLAAIALLACWLPARRAAKVDPVVALRSE
jgi:putative ABC transport system permease protein